jgi:dTDP-4-dehydrorhamnose 3,5-epimerase
MNSCRVEIIDGVSLKPTKLVIDNRGTFLKIDPISSLNSPLTSVALSTTKDVGTVRGLHFQIEPFSEEKLISCVQGAAFDVLVDLRPNSITYGKWMGNEISANVPTQLYVPKGVAHGFQTLMPDTLIHYCLNSEFAPKSYFSISPFADLNVEWPLAAVNLSEKDMQGLTFEKAAKKYSDSLGN